MKFNNVFNVKLLERMLDSFIRNMVDIDEMQFGFVPGRGTTDAIFIVHRLRGKCIAAGGPLCFAFVDLGGLSTVCLGECSGGHWEVLVWRSGLSVSSGACA